MTQLPHHLDAIPANVQTALTGDVHPLRQAAAALQNAGRGHEQTKGRRQPRQLVALLLAHGARAWRSSQPVSHVRLVARAGTGPSHGPAVRLRFRSPGAAG